MTPSKTRWRGAALTWAGTSVLILIVIATFWPFSPTAFPGTTFGLIQVLGPLLAGAGLVLGTLASASPSPHRRISVGWQAGGAILQAGVAFTFFYATSDAIGIGFALFVVVIVFAVAAVALSAVEINNLFAS